MMNRFFTLLLAASCLTAVGQSDCPNPHDSNSDGAVTISDLLDLLGLFGDVDTDQDGVWDSVDECVDTSACNYDVDPTEACAFIDVLGDCGGSCEGDGDGDGICDDEDDCLGVLDECGVCNGPGPTEVVIEDITILYDSVYAEQIDQWFVFEVDVDTTFSYTCAPSFSVCGDPVSYQGHDYATVLIGEQCWFAENCRYLPQVQPSYGPDSLPAAFVFGYYGTDVEEAVLMESYLQRGALYNYYAVTDWQLCPSGWHIPSDLEFFQLEQFLENEGFLVSELKSSGDNLSGDGFWDHPNECGNDLFGFNFVPTGYVNAGGHDWFNWIGFMRTASENYTGNSWVFDLRHDLCDEGSLLSGRGKLNGFAARCIKDVE